MDNDSLFALKLYYEDENEDEYDIIRMLKIELINEGMHEDDVNIRLKEFYDSFGSNIDINIFESIKINNSNHIFDSLNTLINELTNLSNNNSNNNSNNINITQELADYIFHGNNNNIEDVISILNDEDKSKLKKYILERNLEDKCLICFDSMEEKQEVIELPCVHTYHFNCINEYLSNYNYKCPYCKKEVGQPVYKI